MKKKISILLIGLFISIFFFISPKNQVFAQDCSPTIPCADGYRCVLEPLLQYKEGWCVKDNNSGEGVSVDLGQYLTLNNGQKVSDVFSTPADMVNLLVRVVFVIVGLILFAMIVFSGLAMISGSESESKEKAKTTMTSALIGFLVIFAAYWIMQIIKTFTGVDIGF